MISQQEVLEQITELSIKGDGDYSRALEVLEAYKQQVIEEYKTDVLLPVIVETFQLGELLDAVGLAILPKDESLGPLNPRDFMDILQAAGGRVI